MVKDDRFVVAMAKMLEKHDPCPSTIERWDEVAEAAQQLQHTFRRSQEPEDKSLISTDLRVFTRSSLNCVPKSGWTLLFDHGLNASSMKETYSKLV